MTREVNPDWPVFAATEEGDTDQYDLIYDDTIKTDTEGREYEMIGKFLEDDDFYQGLNMITVIRRKGDGKLFGYSWWDDISKHGESQIESNGDEYGLESNQDTDGDFDWDTYISYYVFEPVVRKVIPSYQKEMR